MKRTSFFLVLIIVTALLSAEKMWYRFSEPGNTEEDWVIHTWEDQEPLRVLTTETQDGSTKYFFREDGEVIRQEGLGEEVDYSVTRSGQVLRITGVYEGKRLDARIDLGDRKWLGQIENAYLTMQDQGKNKIFFSVIQPNDPSNLLDLELTIQDSTRINQERVHKLRLNLSGLLSLFWGSDFWINRQGLLIKFQGDTGPGTPFMTVEYLRTES